MRIALLESKHLERKWFMEELPKFFPSAQLFVFRSVEEFLKGQQTILGDYILITEHYLPLLQQGKNEEEMEAQLSELRHQFPWIMEWNHQEAAERLIRHIRQTNKDLPVIIYSHGYEDEVQEDVRNDPKVRYCKKEIDLNNLIKVIRSFPIA